MSTVTSVSERSKDRGADYIDLTLPPLRFPRWSLWATLRTLLGRWR